MSLLTKIKFSGRNTRNLLLLYIFFCWYLQIYAWWTRRNTTEWLLNSCKNFQIQCLNHRTIVVFYKVRCGLYNQICKTFFTYIRKCLEAWTTFPQQLRETNYDQHLNASSSNFLSLFLWFISLFCLMIAHCISNRSVRKGDNILRSSA